nr:unnamed protein product [Callosobruchus analis]
MPLFQRKKSASHRTTIFSRSADYKEYDDRTSRQENYKVAEKKRKRKMRQKNINSKGRANTVGEPQMASSKEINNAKEFQSTSSEEEEMMNEAKQESTKRREEPESPSTCNSNMFDQRPICSSVKRRKKFK